MVSYKKVYRQLEKRIVEVTGIIIVIGILLFVGLTDNYGAVTLKDKVKIMEGWRAIEGHPDSGGTFVISNTIPEELEAREAIVFRSQQQKVKVLVGEQVIYQYPEKGCWAIVYRVYGILSSCPKTAAEKRFRSNFIRHTRCLTERSGAFITELIMNCFIGFMGCSCRCF